MRGKEREIQEDTEAGLLSCCCSGKSESLKRLLETVFKTEGLALLMSASSITHLQI